MKEEFKELRPLHGTIGAISIDLADKINMRSDILPLY